MTQEELFNELLKTIERYEAFLHNHAPKAVLDLERAKMAEITKRINEQAKD